jgi:cobalamin biosynthesis Mg chelatase CobN
MYALRKTILYVIYGALVVLLAVAIILAFKTNKTSSPTTKSQVSTSQPKSQKAETKSDVASTSHSSTSSSSKAAQPSTTSSASNVNSQSSTAANLSNTGPGNTILLFVGTVVCTSLLHFLYTSRKLSSR